MKGNLNRGFKILKKFSMVVARLLDLLLPEMILFFGMTAQEDGKIKKETSTAQKEC